MTPDPAIRNYGGNMKRILYVDFENVSSAGLSGILKLTKNDEVRIFLGPKCSKMSLIEADSVLHCEAKVELIKNDQIGKNALDFIIMVHLGYDIAKGAGDFYFIISNDKGYEPAIHEMQSMTGETIERYADIDQVIARKDEKKGFFAKLFGKKTTVVANTTEHEVLNKRSRNGHAQNSGQNGNGRNNGRTYTPDNRYVNRNRGNNRNGAPRTASGNHNANTQQGSAKRPDNRQNVKPANVKPVVETKAVAKPVAEAKTVTAKATSEAKAVTAKAVAEARPAAKQPEVKAVVKPVVEVKAVAKPVTEAKPAAPKPANETKPVQVKPSTSPVKDTDDSYLDNMSIADLRASLNVKKEAGSQGAKSPEQAPKANNSQAPKAPAKPAAKVEMTDAERDLVNRALTETDNLGDFHNYILKELRDNDRATEIYKAEKHKVGKKNSD